MIGTLPTPLPVLQHGLPLTGRAWLHEPGDPAVGRMAYPGPEAADHARFFAAVAAAEPHAVFMPYLGVWDRTGRPVFAYDLLAYDDEVPPGAEVVANPRVFGVALYDPRAEPGRGADYVRRLHYDVEQVTEGEAVVHAVRHGGEAPRTVERRAWPVRFWEGVHEREGGAVAWDRVEVVGTLFEHPGLLADWGLPYDLAEVLRRLRLRGSERWGSLRAGAAGASAADRPTIRKTARA